MVRQHPKYGNIIWHPALKCHISAVENVQRRARKLVPSIDDISYIDRLQHMKVPSLQHTQILMIFSGSHRSDPDIVFSKLTTDTSKNQRKLDMSRNTFTHRKLNSWNNASEIMVPHHA